MNEQQRAVVQQALEFASDIERGKYKGNAEEIIAALRQLLEQQPVQLTDEGRMKLYAKMREAKPTYTTPPAQPEPVQEPLGYWNAVQGWVELPEEARKPIAWVYPEAIPAFLQGKPWTAYGADGSGPNTDGVGRIPLYTTPPAQPAAWVGLTDEERQAATGWSVDHIESFLREKNGGKV